MNKIELENILKKDFPLEGNIIELETQLNNRMGYLFGIINKDQGITKEKYFNDIFQLNYGMYNSTTDNNIYINAIDKMYKNGTLPMIGDNYK